MPNDTPVRLPAPSSRDDIQPRAEDRAAAAGLRVKHLESALREILDMIADDIDPESIRRIASSFRKLLDEEKEHVW